MPKPKRAIWLHYPNPVHSDHSVPCEFTPMLYRVVNDPSFGGEVISPEAWDGRTFALTVDQARAVVQRWVAEATHRAAIINDSSITGISLASFTRLYADYAEDMGRIADSYTHLKQLDAGEWPYLERSRTALLDTLRYTARRTPILCNLVIDDYAAAARAYAESMRTVVSIWCDLEALTKLADGSTMFFPFNCWG